MKRARHRRAAGFTLVELMIALVIIGVMIMAVAPSLTELLADARQNSAAWDIIRLARRVRGQAVSTGAAHMMVFDVSNNNGANGLGTITVYVGMTNRCTQSPWPEYFETDPELEASETFTMAEYNPIDGSTAPSKTDSSRQVIYFEIRRTDIATPATGGHLAICYQPNGEIYAGEGSSREVATRVQPQTNPFLLLVGRSVDGELRGPLEVVGGTAYPGRQVLFPVGGNARLR